MQKSNIEWTTFTSNPIKYRRKSDGKVVWACVKASTGCAHCYSEGLVLRYDRGKLFNAANMDELEPFLDEAELRQIVKRQTCDGITVAGKRCFVGDMTDVLGEWVPDQLLDRLFAAMALRSDVTFQLLTKRAERMKDYCRSTDLKKIEAHAFDLLNCCNVEGLWDDGCFPFANIWLGVSVENQQAADHRLDDLARTPAAVRFVSYEPALGPVDFWQWLGCPDDGVTENFPGTRLIKGGRQAFGSKPVLDWIIVGGESGPKKRPFDPEWARAVLKQCRAAGVGFFGKQWDKVTPLPDDLMVREFPREAVRA